MTFPAGSGVMGWGDYQPPLDPLPPPPPPPTGPVGPTTTSVIIDDFNRTEAAVWGTASGGGDWTNDPFEGTPVASVDGTSGLLSTTGESASNSMALDAPPSMTHLYVRFMTHSTGGGLTGTSFNVSCFGASASASFGVFIGHEYEWMLSSKSGEDDGNAEPISIMPSESWAIFHLWTEGSFMHAELLNNDMTPLAGPTVVPSTGDPGTIAISVGSAWFTSNWAEITVDEIWGTVTL